MAGTNPGFSAAAFNAGIHAAMSMAAPLAVGDRAAFHFKPTLAVPPAAAADGVPYNPTDIPTRTTPAPITVPCVVEQGGSTATATRMGYMSTSTVRITLLEDDYQSVKDALFVVIAGDRFDYVSTDTPAGLFDAQVWTMHFATSQDL